MTHHLFHPYGSNSLQVKHDENIMRQVAFDDSLQSEPAPPRPSGSLTSQHLLTQGPDRLLSHYWPTLHGLLGRVLSVWAKPRLTPLADAFVLETSARSDPAPFSLLSRMLEKQADGLGPLDVAAEGLDHMAAGIDTTGDALGFLMWELSQPRSLHHQERLRQELQRAEPEVALEQLPFLDAVVSEGLRCFPPIPMSLPRRVPWDGGDRSIGGYLVPPGTVVSCQAYSAQRLDGTVFPNPDRFDPARWLEAEGRMERNKLFFAFAKGGRGCIGKQ